MRNISLFLCLAMLASCGKGSVQVKPEQAVYRTAEDLAVASGDLESEMAPGNTVAWLEKFIEDNCLEVFPSSSPERGFNFWRRLAGRLYGKSPVELDLTDAQLSKVDDVRINIDGEYRNPEKVNSWQEKFAVKSSSGFTTARLANGRIIVGEGLLNQSRDGKLEEEEKSFAIYTAFKTISALSIEDGTMLWRHTPKALIKTFTVLGDRVFVETEAGSYCLDAANGTKRFDLSGYEKYFFYQGNTYNLNSSYTCRLNLDTGSLEEIFNYPKKMKYSMTNQGVIFKGLTPILHYMHLAFHSKFFALFVDDYAIVFFYRGMG